MSRLKNVEIVHFEGFSKKNSRKFGSFPQVKNKLSVEEGIILKRSCVFMPPKFQNFMMDELHLAHQGISAIKAVAPFMCIKARNRYRCGN